MPVLLWPAAVLPSLSTCRDAVDACGFGTPLSAFSAAACGALSRALRAKFVSVRRATRWHGRRVLCWRHPPAYIALGGPGIAAPLQLWMLAATLGGGSVASAVPMYQSLLIVLSVAAGGVFPRV